MEEAPGYAQVRIAPKPEKRLGWLEAALETQHGRIFSGWYYEPDVVCVMRSTRRFRPMWYWVRRHMIWSRGGICSLRRPASVLRRLECAGRLYI